MKMPAQGAGEDVTLHDGWRADKKLLRGGLIALRLGRRTRVCQSGVRAESIAAETEASHGNTESGVLLSHAHRPRRRGAEPVQRDPGLLGKQTSPSGQAGDLQGLSREARPGDLKGNSGARRGDRIETEIWARKRGLDWL